MVRECRRASFGRNGVDASRPETSGCITSATVAKPVEVVEPKPTPKASIGEGGKGVYHIIDSQDRTQSVCKHPIEQPLPYLQLEHWGISGGTWCQQCQKRMGWS